MKVFLFITVLFTTVCVYAQDPVIVPSEKWRHHGGFHDSIHFDYGGYDFFNNNALEATTSYKDTAYYFQFHENDSAYVEWVIREVTVIPLKKPDTTYLTGFKEVKYIKDLEGSEEEKEKVKEMLDGKGIENSEEEKTGPFTVSHYRRNIISGWDACPLKWSLNKNILTLTGQAPFNGRYKIVNKDKAIILERIE